MSFLAEDIIKDFQLDSREVLQELRKIHERLENEPDASSFRDFAQRIDRILGAAQTLAAADTNHVGFATMGTLAAACKKIGYGASGFPALYATVTGFWEDVLDAMDQLIDNIHDPEKCRLLANGFTGVLNKRLAWLTAKLDELGAKAG